MNIVFVADRVAGKSNAKDIGALFWIAQLASSLRLLGHSVRIVSLAGSGSGDVQVPSRSFRAVNFLLRRKTLFGVWDSAAGQALAGADIVHIFSPFSLGQRAAGAAAQAGIPSVASFACIPQDVLSRVRLRPVFLAPLLYRRFRRRFFKRFTHVHCPNQWAAQQLWAHGCTAQLHVIGNGHTESYFGSSAAYPHAPLPETDPALVLAMYQAAIAESRAQDVHKIHLRQTKKLNLTEDYAFVNRAPLFVAGSYLFKYLLIYPLLYTAVKLMLGFKARGRRNLALVKNGAVVASNHVHMLDAPMTSFALFRRQPVITSIKGNFETPGIRLLVRILGAAPIPETPKALGAFMRAMVGELKRGRLVQFYPEAALWPGHTELRPFKNGAFHLAVSSGKPILPMVVKPREPNGLYRLVKKKPCITVQIGQPIWAQPGGSRKGQIEALRDQAHAAMQMMLQEEDKPGAAQAAGAAQ